MDNKQLNLWHKRLPDWEPFDRITMEIVPRYKTSDLSGDEWRQSVKVSFWFKGNIIREYTTSSMKYAILCLGKEWASLLGPFPEAVIESEKILCDHPSCIDTAVNKYLIKQEFSSVGEKLDPSDRYGQVYRQFCDKHSQRGDCSREDSDDNYEKILP